MANIPKFICYKCKYQHFGEGFICPKCNTDNSLPKIGVINFLALLFAVICYIISVFVSKFGIISISLFVLTAILAPFSLMECIVRNKSNDGFKTPETPNDIIENKVRVPDITTLKYEDGLKFDKGINTLIFDVAPDSLKVCKEGMEEITTISYQNIANMQILDDTQIKNSVGKSILSGALGAVAFGGVGAIVGATLGGIDTKNIYYLQFEVNQNNEIGYLQVSGNKKELVELYEKVYEKINPSK